MTSTRQRLAIIGGRLEDDNDAVFHKMRTLSEGRIAIFPTASRVPQEVGEETMAAFRAQGFDASLMPLFWGDHQTVAHDPAIVAQLDEIGHAYFTGGDQARIIGALLQEGKETPLLQKLRELHRRGGLIAGSSAGAAMMSQTSIMGGASLEAIVYGVTEDSARMGMLMGQGLGFFRGGLVDQHFLQRGRLGRLLVGMFAAGEVFGFGIDENTAMFVEGDEIHVLGESGVIVLDIRDAFASNYSELGSDYCSVKMHFLDDGDRYRLTTQALLPGPAKDIVTPSSISYTSPGHIHRSVFGANTILELLTRIAEGAEKYRYDKATAYDPEAELEVTLHLKRPKRSVSYSALYGQRREYSVSGFEFDLTCEAMPAETRRRRQHERAHYNAQKHIYTNETIPGARLIATGSGLLHERSASLVHYLKDNGLTPISIVAAASSRPESACADYIEMLKQHGLEAKDLNIYESNTLYQSQNESLFQELASSPAILLLGGAQERLVDTLLYRGENNRVLHSIIHAYRHGAALIAVSGAASSLSQSMLGGGSTLEALRYGISADTWLQGVIIEPGFGFLRNAIIDQNVHSCNRLGRLLVACAEEEERFGFGLLEHSGMVMTGHVTSIEAIGLHGFLLLDLGDACVESGRDFFSVRDARVSLVRPGQHLAFPEGTLLPKETQKPLSSGAISLQSLFEGLKRDGEIVSSDAGSRCVIEIEQYDEDRQSAVLHVEVNRSREGRRPIRELD